MPELEPITREETLLDGDDLTPITRKEMFIKRIYDKTQTIPEPITREEYFLKKAGEGSGGDVTIEQLNVTRNGTYSESGKAYSPVVVNVKTPDNAYLLEDAEGLPGDIASFEASELPMNKLKVGIEPQQDLHGYDSPWVGGAGKNKLPMTVDGIKQINTSGVWNGNTYTFHDVTFKIETDEANNVTGIKVNGTSGGMAYFNIFDGDLTLSEGTKVLSGCVLNGSESTYYLQITAMPNSYTDVGNGISFTDEGNVRCNVTINMTDGTSLTNALFQPMIEYGSAKTAFEPYSNICPISGWSAVNVVVSPTTDAEDGQTYNIQFRDGDNPLIVYGGSLDVVSGELTVDRAIVDLGTLAWGLRDSGTVVAPYFFADIENLGVKYEGIFNIVVYSILCSMYKIVRRDIPAFVDGTICIDGAAGERKVTQLQIKDARYSDAAAFKTAMNGVQLVYELATPITYQLTPTQVKSLLGSNNVWSDTGEVIEAEHFTKGA